MAVHDRASEKSLKQRKNALQTVYIFVYMNLYSEYDPKHSWDAFQFSPGTTGEVNAQIDWLVATTHDMN